MQFLGNLGIDPKLLIAQIVNFALLIWLLSYFVYKPFIKSVEKNEAEITEARKQKKALEDEKGAFARQKENELTEARALGKKIVEEAKTATEAIKIQVYESTKKESALLVEQTKEALASQKPMLVREVSKEMMLKFSNGFRDSFDQFVEPEYQSDFQDILFKSFIDQVAGAPVQRLSASDIAELKKIRTRDAAEFNTKILERVGAVSLEYAVSLSPVQHKKVERVVAKKIGLPVPVAAKQNKRLINGFSLELMGRVVESNLSKIVQHAETVS
jgi:F-type H+-transporting ATPase subunit b